jgi:hypothetical protein
VTRIHRAATELWDASEHADGSWQPICKAGDSENRRDRRCCHQVRKSRGDLEETNDSVRKDNEMSSLMSGMFSLQRMLLVLLLVLAFFAGRAF